MRLLAKGFVLLLAMGLIVGCASLGAEPGTGGTGGAGGAGTRAITVFCSNSAGSTQWALDWKLTVRPEPIKSGEPFAATLEGVAVFPEAFIDSGHETLPEGVQRGNLVELNATVHVRSGATGAPVTLTADPELYEYECFVGRTACNPANDVTDDPSKLPGLRANNDCEPVSDLNPCGRFLVLDTSTDCEPGGECDRLGKRDQCTDLRNSCITGELTIQLKQESPPAQYTADAQAEEALFGWAETGAHYVEDPTDPNYETYILPTLYDGDLINEEAYLKPTGPIGIRATFEGLPVAFECVMGVACEVGVECTELRPKRTPESELIAFPIEKEAP